MAQELEHFHLEEAIAGHDVNPEAIPPSRRLNLRRYGTHGGTLLDKEGDDDYKNMIRHDQHHYPIAPPSTLNYDGVESTSTWTTSFEMLLDFIWHESSKLDLVRTSSMGVWAVTIYTPFFMWLYRQFDKMFPKKNTFAIMSRVVLAVGISVPVNAAFFTYGTFVHHTLEWMEMRKEWKETRKEDEEWEQHWTLYEEQQQRQKLTPNSDNNNKEEPAQTESTPKHLSTIPPPYDIEMMISK
eukprot:13105637-Ditylum_brightwellii.AAC.1